MDDLLAVFERKLRVAAAASVLGIELGANQQNDAAQVKPEHQRDHRTKRPVGLVVVGKFAQVDSQAKRNEYPCAYCEDRARQRGPEALLDVGCEKIQQLNGENRKPDC